MADAVYSDQRPPNPGDSWSPDRLQLITQAAQLYWWEWDLQTNQTTYSPNTEQIIGRSPAQSLEENLQLLHPDDRHLSQQALEEAQKQGADSFQYQVRSIAIPAQIKWVQVSGQLYRDAQRRVVRVTGVAQDITARKLAELALQENDQQQTYLLRLSDTLRTLADPILIQQVAMQLLGQHLQVSRAFYGDMQADQDTLLIGPGYAQGTFPLELQVRFSEFEADLTAYYGKGQTVVMDDVNAHPLVNDQSKAEFALIDCRAAVGVPLLKAGRVRAILSLHQRVPRHWTATEITLAQETAERTWEAVERARVEEALRQSEKRFRLAIEATELATWEWNLETNEVYWNEQHFRLFGMQPQPNPIGPDAFMNHVHPAERERISGLLHKAITERSVYNTEFCALLEDGSQRWMSGYGRIMEERDGKPLRMSGVMFDVDERRHIQDALHQSEARQRAILQSAKDYAIFTTDLDRRITSWSQGAQALFGYKAEEILHQSADLLFTIEDRQQGAPATEAQKATRVGEAENERWHLRQDGSRFYGSGVVTPLRDAAGAIVGLLKVMRDLTVQKRHEEALKEIDQRKDEFLAMLAHELRNPMSTIRSGLQILGLTEGNEQTSRATIAMMNRQTDHLVRLVDDLLDVSRINQGKIALKRERLELGSLLSAAIDAIRPQFETSQKSLRLSPDTSASFVYGDATRLTQVVNNLLTNGLRYTGAQGQVWVSLSHQNGEALLRVTDNGIGLSEDQLRTIFDLFVQADNSFARSGGGLGVGLTLVRRLVELHGGRVAASSAGLGQGSTFTIYLPLVEGPEHELASATTASLPTTTRILVIDDNADAALTLSMLLTLKGYEVHSCLSGREGIQAAESLRPAVILCDIGMPDLDGYETVRAIRQQAWGLSVVVIALTGYGQAEDKQRVKEAGFDGHLVKPVDLRALLALLTKVLPSG